ncbi:ZIP family metal transporter [Pragia fontium]|uniref:Zinc transporter, ZIP family n=2 Tax=Pragia fontium TaxID=82985 RepID=A0AAJ5BG84_9GAMM|nr:transporter [Pragia fontium]GKX63166.1 membrane protein [Pragia fontium]SFC31658.1 zinc transporter, ZIP family [Pragia fontium DSM 5563 = ATCC 49100]SUB81862.1 ZIP Zinc transporter [Pragia fontium]VEJ54426.1 ZIP Zinc transporter [Pragia fontium]
MTVAVLYTLIPAAAAIIGASVALFRRPGDGTMSIIHHFTAGIVFSAVAVEILPDLKGHSLWAVLLGSITGVILMLGIKYLGEKAEGPVGFISAVGIDIFIDGLVLGIAFAAGAKTGMLLTLALTLEILFLGLSVVGELRDFLGNRRRALAAVIVLASLLPIGSMLGAPLATLGTFWLTTFLAFGLTALLYLVTEELLVEAHEGGKDTPLATAMFFAGFILLLVLEESM